MRKPIIDLEFVNRKNRLVIQKNVAEIFHKHEQKNGEGESGGILLGYVYPDYTEICAIVTPGNLDKFGRLFFIRSKQGAQRRINKAWKKSDGRRIYLGEWHTHSQKHPVPSNVDKNMIKKQLIETEMEINFLYLVIVGQNDTYWIGRQSHKALIVLARLRDN